MSYNEKLVGDNLAKFTNFSSNILLIQVFKGYHKESNRDIAAKVIKRSLIKGKLSSLLDNEIKILSTCKNPNILKLYDIRKTQNNFYLMLEYCNEGDLTKLLAKKKHLNEDEAVPYFL